MEKINYSEIRNAARRAFRDEKKRNLLLGEIEGWAEHTQFGGASRTWVYKEKLAALLEHLKKSPEIVRLGSSYHIDDDDIDRFAKELGVK